MPSSDCFIESKNCSYYLSIKRFRIIEKSYDDSENPMLQKFNFLLLKEDPKKEGFKGVGVHFSFF
ncbi:MAG TPA: hypothetical protein DF698_09395 [Candidatus Atribacteria bacterium]|nr:hypothetical protein [Candidatus Atribacteria bacterium]